MAYNTVLQMYVGWANSLLCERGVLINTVDQLQDGRIFVLLVDVLTNENLPFDDSGDETEGSISRLQAVIDFMHGHGILISCSPQDVVDGDIKSILDMLWALILHFTIHSIDTPSTERSVRNGRKVLLEWCSHQLGSDAVNPEKNLIENFKESTNLADLIEEYTTPVMDDTKQETTVGLLSSALISSEETLGILKSLVSPADVINGTVNEYALLIYLALLRRKVTLLSPSLSVLSTTTSEDELQNATFSAKLYALVLEHTLSFKFVKAPSNSSSYRLPPLTTTPTNNNNRKRTSPKSLYPPKQSESKLKTSAQYHSNSLLSKTSSVSSLESASNVPPYTVTSKDFPSYSPGKDQYKLQEKPSGTDFQTDVEFGGMRVEPFGAESEDMESKVGKVESIKASSDSPNKSRQTLEDELLGLLDTIGTEGKQLRDELEQAQEREVFLLEQLQDHVSEKHEEKVIARLVQELEMLRNENRRLFRELADARNDAVQYRKKVQTLISKLSRTESELERIKAENFKLKTDLQLHGRERGEGGSDSEMSVSELSPSKKEAIHSAGFSPNSQTSKKLQSLLHQSFAENKNLRAQLSCLGAEAEEKAIEFANEVSRLKDSNLQLVEDNKNLKRLAENESGDLEVANNKIGRLEKYLNTMREQNAKLVSHLSNRRDAGSESDFSQEMFVMEKENEELKKRLRHTENDRDILRKELAQVRDIKSYDKETNQKRMDNVKVAREYTRETNMLRSKTSPGVQSFSSKQRSENSIRRNLVNGICKLPSDVPLESQGKYDASSKLTSMLHNEQRANENIFIPLPDFRRLPNRPTLMSESECTQTESEYLTDDERQKDGQRSEVNSSDYEHHWRTPSLGDLIVERSQVNNERNIDPDSGMASTMQSAGNVEDNDGYTTANESTIVDQTGVEELVLANESIFNQSLYLTPASEFNTSTSLGSRSAKNLPSSQTAGKAIQDTTSHSKLQDQSSVSVSPYKAYTQYLKTNQTDSSGNRVGPQLNPEREEVQRAAAALGTFGSRTKTSRIPRWRQLRYSQASSPTKGTFRSQSKFGSDYNKFSPLASAKRSFPMKDWDNQPRNPLPGLEKGILTEYTRNNQRDRTSNEAAEHQLELSPEKNISQRFDETFKENQPTEEEFRKLPDQLNEPQKLAELSPPRCQRSPGLKVSPSLRTRLRFGDPDTDVSSLSVSNESRIRNSEEPNHLEGSYSRQSPAYESSYPTNQPRSPAFQYRDNKSPDAVAEKILREADSGISLASAGFEGMGREEKEKYIHEMLTESEQSYANSIIEKYLSQVSG